MNGIAVSDFRNITLMGHTGCGKTTLIDALLFKLGLNDRQGSVSAGSSMADYTDEEKHRKITAYAKPFMANFKSAAGKKFGLCCTDTPGFMDFYGQVISACRSTETAVIVIDASAGLQVGTHRTWKYAEKQGMPKAIIITGLDKENTSFQKTIDAIQQNLGSKCVPVTIPTSDGKNVIDVFDPKAGPEAESIKNQVSELAAETDDKMIEEFLAGQPLTAEELSSGIKNAVKKGTLVPIFVCMPLKSIGLNELLEGIANYLPSPADLPAKDAEGKAIPTDADGPMSAFVWRTINDPFVGHLAFVRVLGGTLKADSEIYNATKDQKEKIGNLVIVNGKKTQNVTSATAGDIVALPKLKLTSMNDTLCDIGKKVICPPMTFPGQVMFMAVVAKSQTDEDKIGVALAKITEEDPTMKVFRNTETKETIISGLGDVHIDLAAEKMKIRSHVEVVLSTPKVPYRETITGTGEGHCKHKKQSGGRGQYAEVYLKVSPKHDDSPDWFVDDIVGGVIPGNFVPACQKGAAEAMIHGPLASYTVTHVKVSVYDGSYHDVDSSEIAFKIAAGRAFKDAMMKAKPVLQEPLMTIKVSIPEQYLGDINGDLNHKRGRIMGMETAGGIHIITAVVPQAELFHYVAELRSITAGQGTFETEFCRYDVVPSNIAQKVIASAVKHKEEED